MKVAFNVKAVEEVEIPEMMELDVFKRIKSGEFKTSQEVFDYCLSQGEEVDVKINDNSIVTDGSSSPAVDLEEDIDEEGSFVTLYHFEQGWRLFKTKEEFITLVQQIFDENESGNEKEFLDSINLKKPETHEEGVSYLKEYCEGWEVVKEKPF